ncbi:MAG: hypothetical protein COA36_09645 [Desulfotalea sp.]|nr:MAG: hypothetical protein COA36_09645 [Desulfotalea sp.]
MNYILDEKNSKSSFIAYAPMHKFKGWADGGLTGTVDVDTDDFTISKFLVAAETGRFDTGDPGRNKAMMEFFDLKKHSETSFTLTELKSIKSTGNNKYQATLVGILDFAGIRRQLPIVCNIVNGTERIVFDMGVKWSFKAYGIKAPQLLFLTVRDIVDITAHLEFIPVQGDV